MPDLSRKILNAAIRLVAEQGVRQMSFREVARRARVSHQAPYHLFQNAQGILRAIAQEGFSQLTEAMVSSAHAAGADPIRALEAAGVAYVRFARENPGHFRVMFQKALVDIHDKKNPLPEGAGTHQTLVNLVTAAHQAGYGGGHSIEVMTLLCWSAVHGLACLIVEGTVPESDQARVRAVIGALARLSENDE